MNDAWKSNVNLDIQRDMLTRSDPSQLQDLPKSAHVPVTITARCASTMGKHLVAFIPPASRDTTQQLQLPTEDCLRNPCVHMLGCWRRRFKFPRQAQQNGERSMQRMCSAH